MTFLNGLTEWSKMELTSRQKRFFDDFGFLFLPGLMGEEAPWIVEAFEMVFDRAGIVHDGSRRSSLSAFIERDFQLCSLLDNPKVNGLLAGLLGEDFNYLGSGGELYVGDGQWHPDCHIAPVRQVKWAMYLDALTPETGSLRLVPGSHRSGLEGNIDTRDRWGIGMKEVPCFVPDNAPGDVIVFDLKTLHNALGGGNRRRMLNLVACSSCRTGAELDFLRSRLPASRSDLNWDMMRRTATPERMRYLEQPWNTIK